MTPVLICPHVGPYSDLKELQDEQGDLRARMAAALPEDRPTYQAVIDQIERWIAWRPAADLDAQ